MQDLADPHARDRAYDIARQDPPAGVPEVREALDSSSIRARSVRPRIQSNAATSRPTKNLRFCAERTTIIEAHGEARLGSPQAQWASLSTSMVQPVNPSTRMTAPSDSEHARTPGQR